MNVTLLEKYIQITVQEDNDFLHKALAYAEKYFSKSYRLSSTVLILDDGERFKKDYLVNWAYYAFGQDEKSQGIARKSVDSVDSKDLRDSADSKDCKNDKAGKERVSQAKKSSQVDLTLNSQSEQDLESKEQNIESANHSQTRDAQDLGRDTQDLGRDSRQDSQRDVARDLESKDLERDSQQDKPLEDLKYLLNFTYLPIRIKIVSKNSLIQRVHIRLGVLNNKRVMLKMSKPSSVARRYIAQMFEDYFVGCDRDEIYLDSTKPYFWESIMDLISFKVIANVILDFDYDSFKNRGGLGSFDSSFLTEEERTLRRCYMTLECHYQDDFKQVKKNYLRLAKVYHPDNVYGQDDELIESYHDRFQKIQEAYERIKHYCVS